MILSQKTNRVLMGAAAICVLFISINRDIQLEKQYTGDLRNRIVGARLQKDGRLPYFYKWSPADGLRYYDPQNFDSLTVSNITATPFTHQLLYPLADLPQRSISKIWLLIEYISLLLTVILALSFAKKKEQQWMVIFSSALFLFTAGWKNHIAGGQYYLLIPALSMVFYYLIHRKGMAAYFIAGLVAASLVLIRPNTVWFFLPFTFLFFRWPVRNKLIFFAATLLPFLFNFAGSYKMACWKDFSQAMQEQVKAHQGLSPTTSNNAPDPHYMVWEGWNKQQVQSNAALHPFHFESEHGNLFVVSRWLFHLRVPVWLLVILPAFFLLMIAAFYKIKQPGASAPLFPLAILAFCLYMLSDISSPFHRFQYNTVQWLFPVLLVAAYSEKRNKWLYVLSLAGIALNIIEIRSIAYEHTAGEYLLFLALVIIGYRSIPAHRNKINLPA